MPEEIPNEKPQVAGHYMAMALIDSGSLNYYGELLETSIGRDIEVIARYVDGETPVDQLRKAQERIEVLERANREAFNAGLKAGRTQAYMTEQGAKPVAGEVEALVVKIQSYEKTLLRIKEGCEYPDEVAFEVLDPEGFNKYLDAKWGNVFGNGLGDDGGTA